MDRRAAILEMHVPDALTMPANACEWIATAETVMTGIETQADEFGIGQVEQSRDFVWCLDESGGVRMNHTSQTGLFADSTGDLLNAFGKDGPLRVAQTVISSNPSGFLRSRRMGGIVVCQHDER